ncbi:MAG: hypothetical protein RLZZ292_1765 [Bacteroidota bacterium]|jgi:hypothetical protein
MIQLLQNYGSYSTITAMVIASLILLPNVLQLSTLMRKITIYIFIGCLFEVASTGYIKIFHSNNLFFFHGFAIFEVWILSIFFFEFYEKHTVFLNKNTVLIPAVVFLIINSLFIQPITTFNSHGLTLVGIVAIACCVYAFYLMLEKESRFPFYQEVKWFIIAIFLAHSGMLIVELFSNQILRLEKNQQSIIWAMRTTLILITRLIFLYIAIQTFRVEKNGK